MSKKWESEDELAFAAAKLAFVVALILGVVTFVYYTLTKETIITSVLGILALCCVGVTFAFLMTGAGIISDEGYPY